VQALRQIDDWPVEFAVAGVVDAEGRVSTRGEAGRSVPLASVTKPVAALAVLVAAEEGVVDLDEPAGPEGSTIRHLLAHASGLPFHGDKPIARPGTRRVYSNTGFEQLAAHVERAAEMPFPEYLRQAVFAPLAMSSELRGSAGSEVYGTLDDLVALVRELQAPTLVAAETLGEMTSVQFAGLNGVLPDVGRFDPNDWGLGVELRDRKQPHWTGTQNSERTFGHFGGSGTFLWVDPAAGLALACLTDREFDSWALEAWPRLSDAVLGEA
jgi:CubicO group peptidase (beta-lactamase class C family)